MAQNNSNENTYRSFSQMSDTERKEFQQKAFASINKMVMQDVSKVSRTSTFLSRFKVEEVSKWLQNPSQYEKQLRQLSQYLYNVSPHYRRLILYMSQMPIYAYTVEPYDMPDKIDVEKFKKQYKKTLQQIEKMNVRHEFSKASKTAFREDFFFAYIHESKDSFFFQKLNPDNCRISSIEDGVFNFAFDFSVFDRDKDLLDTYPIEFKEKYQTFKSLGRDSQWQELGSDNTLAIKIQDDLLEYGLPPFNTVFEAVFDLDEYKRMKKARTKVDNFMLLIQKIPMDDKNPDINKFLVDLTLAAALHEKASEVVGDNIGLVTTPLEITPIRTDQSKNSQDLIAQATREVYSDSGISQHLFNSDKTTSTGLAQSITVDEQIAFSFLRQVERWINRRLKKMSGQYKFNFKFLDITVFNQEDKFDMYLKGAQSGLPVITEAAASIGLSPLDLMNKATLENEILGLHNILQPLKSAHTQSGKDGAGAPKKDDKEISDSTGVNRDANTDENRE